MIRQVSILVIVKEADVPIDYGGTTGRRLLPGKSCRKCCRTSELNRKMTKKMKKLKFLR